MGIGQVIMMLVIVVGLGAYYWWKVGRRGGAEGYHRHLLGLREGEQVTSQWGAFYDYDEHAAAAAAKAAFGVQTRNEGLVVGLTSGGRLVIGHLNSGDPALGFERGQVAVSERPEAAKIGTIAGSEGMEQARVVMLSPVGAQPFRIQIAGSAARELQSWAS